MKCIILRISSPVIPETILVLSANTVRATSATSESNCTSRTHHESLKSTITLISSQPRRRRIQRCTGLFYVQLHHSAIQDANQAYNQDMPTHPRWGGKREGSGRPLSNKPRCACGAMTAHRAELKHHICRRQQQNTPVSESRRLDIDHDFDFGA